MRKTLQKRFHIKEQEECRKYQKYITCATTKDCCTDKTRHTEHVYTCIAFNRNKMLKMNQSHTTNNMCLCGLIWRMHAADTFSGVIGRRTVTLWYHKGVFIQKGQFSYVSIAQLDMLHSHLINNTHADHKLNKKVKINCQYSINTLRRSI